MSVRHVGGRLGRHEKVVAVMAAVGAVLTVASVVEPSTGLGPSGKIRIVVMFGASLLLIGAVATELDRRWPRPTRLEATMRLTPIVVATAVGWLLLADGWVHGFGFNLATGASLAAIGVALGAAIIATARRRAPDRPAQLAAGPVRTPPAPAPPAPHSTPPPPEPGAVPFQVAGPAQPTARATPPHLVAGVFVAAGLFGLGFLLAVFVSLCSGDSGFFAMLAVATGVAAGVLFASRWLDRRYPDPAGWALPVGRVLAIASTTVIVGYLILISLPSSGSGCN